MKLHAMEAIHYLHSLREKVLHNGGEYLGFTMENLQELESKVLQELPSMSRDFPDLVQEEQAFLEFLGALLEDQEELQYEFLKYYHLWSGDRLDSSADKKNHEAASILDELSSRGTSASPEDMKADQQTQLSQDGKSKDSQAGQDSSQSANHDIPESQSLSAEQAISGKDGKDSSSDVESVREIPQFEETKKRESAAKKLSMRERVLLKVKPQRLRDEPWPEPAQSKVQTPKPKPVKVAPQEPGILEVAWHYFRDELTINWFLFLGAFMVFSAGLFYTLVWWKDFDPVQQYLVTLAALGFSAGMQVLLEKGMKLQKSPRIFAGMYALFLPMILLIHARIDLLYFAVTYALTFPLTARSLSRYYSLDRKTFYSLQGVMLFIPVSLMINTLAGAAAVFFYLLILAAVYLWIRSRLLEQSRTLVFFFAWSFAVFHFPFLEFLTMLWVAYVFCIGAAGPKASGAKSSGFLYGSYAMIFLASLASSNPQFAYVASVLLTFRLHQWTEDDQDKARSHFTTLYGSAVLLALPIVVNEFGVQVSSAHWLLIQFIVGAYVAFFTKRYDLRASGFLLFVYWITCSSLHFSEPVFWFLHAISFAGPLFWLQFRYRPKELSSWEVLFGGIITSFSSLKFLSWCDCRLLLVSALCLGAGVALSSRMERFNSFLRLSSFWLIAGTFVWVFRSGHHLNRIYFEVFDYSLHLGWFKNGNELIWYYGLWSLVLALLLHLVEHERYSGANVLMVSGLVGIVYSGIWFPNSVVLAWLAFRVPFLLLLKESVQLNLSKLGLERDSMSDRQREAASGLLTLHLILAVFGVPLSPLYLLPSIVLFFLFREGSGFWIAFLFAGFSLSAYPIEGTEYLVYGSLPILAFFLGMSFLFSALISISKSDFFLLKGLPAFELITLLLGIYYWTLLDNSNVVLPLIFFVVFLAKILWQGYARSNGFVFYLLLVVNLALLYTSKEVLSMEISIGLVLLQALVYFKLSLDHVFRAGKPMLFQVAQILLAFEFSRSLIFENVEVLYLSSLVPLLFFVFVRRVPALIHFGGALLTISLIAHEIFPFLGIVLVLAMIVYEKMHWSGFEKLWIWTGVWTLAHALGAFADGSQIASLLSLLALGTYFLRSAYVFQKEQAVYAGMLAIGFLVLFLKAWGYIGDSGVSSYVLLGVALALNWLTRVCQGRYLVYERPFLQASELIPFILVLKEWIGNGSPVVLLFTGFYFEWLHRGEKLSYKRLMALLCYNVSLFVFVGESDFVLELMSVCSGVSVLWYANTIEEDVSRENLQVLKVLGNGLFYAGSVFNFVQFASFQSLLILWAFAFVGGWISLMLQARIQLFSALLIFCGSLIFFIIRQLLMKLTVGIPLIAGLGLLLIFIGVVFEMNREGLFRMLESWRSRLDKWRD